jgi:hypothetical protein
MRGQPYLRVFALSCSEGQFLFLEDDINEHYLYGITKFDVHF